MIALDCRCDRVDHVLVVERFWQEVDGARLHGADRHGHVAVASHQHDRKANTQARTSRLELQPADARQSDVENDAAGSVMHSGIKKLLHRRVSYRVQSDRPEQQAECVAQREIIIDHMDYRALFGGHVSGGSDCRHTHPPDFRRIDGSSSFKEGADTPDISDWFGARHCTIVLSIPWCQWRPARVPAILGRGAALRTEPRTNTKVP